MKKIAFLIHSLGLGGMEKVMSQLAYYFCQKENVELHIILFGKTREVFYSVPENVVIHKPSFKFNNQYRPFYTFKTIYFLRKKIKQIHPDSILSFGEIWNNLVLIALFGIHIPLYISDRSRPGKDLGKLNNFLKKKLYPRASGIIAQTNEAKDLLLKQTNNNNIKVIGNPVSFSFPAKNPEKENIILSVGRLIDTKHYDRLIKIFMNINPPDWKFVIVGDDAQNQKNRSKLEKIIRQNGFEDKIILAGKQKNIEDYYLKSKIFAFTSSSEGFPNVVAEAMSAGLPVVAYNGVAGSKDLVIDGRNGFLVPLFDDEIFEKRLKYLIKDDNLRSRMSSEAKRLITRYDISRVGESFFNFITG